MRRRSVVRFYLCPQDDHIEDLHFLNLARSAQFYGERSGRSDENMSTFTGDFEQSFIVRF
jgi:hypothetical protein